MQHNAPEALTVIQTYVLPETWHQFEQTDVDTQPDPTESFWQLLHPRIVALARPRFEQGFFGDAVECSFKEVNETVKRLFVASEGRELDGHGLMTTAFSPTNPVIKLTNLSSQSERDEQQGYMQIYAGAMTGIRNPKAHGNLNPDPRKTMHLISLASLLMCRLEERI